MLGGNLNVPRPRIDAARPAVTANTLEFFGMIGDDGVDSGGRRWFGDDGRLPRAGDEGASFRVRGGVARRRPPLVGEEARRGVLGEEERRGWRTPVEGEGRAAVLLALGVEEEEEEEGMGRMEPGVALLMRRGLGAAAEFSVRRWISRA